MTAHSLQVSPEYVQHPPVPALPADNYYYLPFCKPAGAQKATHKWGGLGEVLEGNQLIDSQIEVKFRSEFRARREWAAALAPWVWARARMLPCLLMLLWC